MVAAVFHEIDVAEKGSAAAQSLAAQTETPAAAAPKATSGVPMQANPPAVKAPRF